MRSEKVYLGDVPAALGDDGIRALFRGFASVVAIDAIDLGEGVAFAIVTLSSPEEADEAATRLNRAIIGGRPIVVNRVRDVPR